MSLTAVSTLTGWKHKFIVENLPFLTRAVPLSLQAALGAEFTKDITRLIPINGVHVSINVGNTPSIASSFMASYVDWLDFRFGSDLDTLDALKKGLQYEPIKKGCESGAIREELERRRDDPFQKGLEATFKLACEIVNEIETTPDFNHFMETTGPKMVQLKNMVRKFVKDATKGASGSDWVSRLVSFSYSFDVNLNNCDGFLDRFRTCKKSMTVVLDSSLWGSPADAT